MNFTKLLTSTIGHDIETICVNITTITDDYYFSFIEYEDYEKLGIFVTGDDGRERFTIINKKHIVSIEVVYQQDLKPTKKKEEDRMFI